MKRWLTFLRNHREAIAAMDFFTVLTLTFGFLYCFFVIGHDRRKILHFHVTRNPHALWVVQQLREAWAYTEPHRFLLFDITPTCPGDHHMRSNVRTHLRKAFVLRLAAGTVRAIRHKP